MISVATSRPPQNPCSPFSPRITFPSSPCSPLRIPISFYGLQSRASVRSLSRRLSAEKNRADELFDGFSELPSEVPWKAGDVWSIFAAYFFVLHIPLSFGGLSVVSQILHEPDLDPLTIVVSTILLQVTEYVGISALLHYHAKPQSNVREFFHGKWFVEERSWIIASVVGIGSLVGLIFVTSIVADILVGPKDVNNPVLKEILLKSPLSMTVCFSLYCLISPMLEETVYRGFLLSSLAPTMKWWQAVIISSFFFSIGHFSGENSLQLFLIGCVLGSAYCWTGGLASCLIIHSVYNAIILLITIMS
ncbi:hypothetical protein Cni_G15935 [Canna indica]|uniref:CAAX prenyl protease 2/Lysostaphin resistance protein A-like domain-containing protein n=1 Tax=Canna indica TaxID=4628 RepID=A0AAQ3KEN2_9LILI|nr:hypothetical protein Cni_G15935 [Canna indica]